MLNYSISFNTQANKYILLILAVGSSLLLIPTVQEAFQKRLINAFLLVFGHSRWTKLFEIPALQKPVEISKTQNLEKTFKTLNDLVFSVKIMMIFLPLLVAKAVELSAQKVIALPDLDLMHTDMQHKEYFNYQNLDYVYHIILYHIILYKWIILVLNNDKNDNTDIFFPIVKTGAQLEEDNLSIISSEIPKINRETRSKIPVLNTLAKDSILPNIGSDIPAVLSKIEELLEPEAQIAIQRFKEIYQKIASDQIIFLKVEYRNFKHIYQSSRVYNPSHDCLGINSCPAIAKIMQQNPNTIYNSQEFDLSKITRLIQNEDLIKLNIEFKDKNIVVMIIFEARSLIKSKQLIIRSLDEFKIFLNEVISVFNIKKCKPDMFLDHVQSFNKPKFTIILKCDII